MRAASEIRDSLGELLTLRTLPATAARISALLDDRDVGVVELVEVIEADQVLTGRLLRLANSALYARPVPIGTIQEAVMQVGFTSLRNLVLSIEAVATFSVPDRSDFKLSSFWEHSVATALCSASCIPTQSAEAKQNAFVVGLLHDLGKVILLNLFPKDVASLLARAIDEEKSFTATEESYFELSHAQVGAVLARAWRFPEDLVGAIEHHHANTDEIDASARVAQQGDRLALGYFPREAGRQEPVEESFFPQIGTTQERWEAEELPSIQERVQVVCSAILGA